MVFPASARAPPSYDFFCSEAEPQVAASPSRTPPAIRGQTVITNYISEALHRTRYSVVDGGTFCATVAGLSGVVATGASLEACRDQLAEVVEEWVLVRVSRGLSVPRLGTARVQVRRAS